MSPQNLHELPRMRDSLSYHYIEKAVIDRDQNAIEVLKFSPRTWG